MMPKSSGLFRPATGCSRKDDVGDMHDNNDDYDDDDDDAHDVHVVSCMFRRQAVVGNGDGHRDGQDHRNASL